MNYMVNGSVVFIDHILHTQIAEMETIGVQVIIEKREIELKFNKYLLVS